MSLKLKVRCGPNPRLEPMFDGTVKAPNVDLEFEQINVDRLFYLNIKHDDFEVSEMSISETLLSRDRRDRYGNGRWDWYGLPVYLARGHGWTRISINKHAGIHSLADLKGKRVGIPDYCMTFALWMKATLKDLYGIEARDVSWYNMRPRDVSQGLELGLDQDPPPGVSLTWLKADDDAASMLDRGDLDAAVGLAPARLEGKANITSLFDDGGKGIIYDYFRQSRCFQPNHHFIVQNRILKEHPWVAMELYETFELSKLESYRRARQALPAYLYFEGQDFKDQAAVFGEDPFPLGLKAMRHTLERAVQASLEQGLIRRPIDLEDVYFPSTHGT